MLIFRDWKIVKKIGAGSFGTVYQVENTDTLRTGEKAALKVITIPQNDSEIEVLRSERYDDASITDTFREQLHDIVDEYKIMRTLSGHTNIINCLDVGYVQHDDGFGWDIFIVMELLTPLRKIPEDVFDEGEIVKLGTDMCRALSLCAKHGIMHRDVKPDNIFRSRDGDYKLGDFGIARVMDGSRAFTGGIGTYDYMAPEVYSEKAYDFRADICSLGLVLYWLLNERRLPFLPLSRNPSKAEKEDARNRRFSGEPIPTPAHGSKELQQIVLKACAFDPEDRYQSAEEMLTDLAKLGGVRVDIPPVTVKSDSEKENEKNINYNSGENNTTERTEETIGSLGGRTQSKADSDPTEEYKTVRVFTDPPQPMPKPTPKPKKWRGAVGVVAALALIAAGLYYLPGWEAATCESPETHKLLGITRGEALGHQYTGATCTEASVCTVCGEESEGPIGHAWEEATCTTPKTCSVCGETEGTALGHKWEAATCTEPKTCPVCGETEGAELGHKWIAATYHAPKTCSICGATEGSVLTGWDWTLENGVLTIDGNGPMDNFGYSSVDHFNFKETPWFEQREQIYRVVIEKGVTSVGDFAFECCTNLTSIIIPDSVNSIGVDAFLSCESLTLIAIPDSVTSIGERAFSDCKSLTSITIPDSVISIEEGAFNSCRSLKSITIPSRVTSLSRRAFTDCKSLTSIAIPDGVTSIGEFAFSVCENLASITIPDSVTHIGEGAFMSCDDLKDIYYGGSQQQWRQMVIEPENEHLTNATIHYNAA